MIPRCIRKLPPAIAPIALGLFSASAQSVQLLDEHFDSGVGVFKDLSTAVTWKGAPENGSVFETVDGALQMNEEAWIPGMWGAEEGMLAFSALDFQFPQVINRTTNTITVEWRMRFEEIDQRGETNRVAVMLTYDYPDGGLDLTPDLRLTDYSDQWWARPAYQVRIRGGYSAADAAPYLIDGGGRDIEGEFESVTLDGIDHWLPGFVSSPGGKVPGKSPRENFPIEGYVNGTTTPASTTFKRYRYTVEPDRMFLEVNHADDGVTWENELEMPLPREDEAPTDPAPPLYKYFEEVEGLRLYFRGPGTGRPSTEVYIDYITLSVEGDFSLEGEVPSGFTQWLAGFPSIPEALNGLYDDPDHDGIENLLEYAIGFSPVEFEQFPTAELVRMDEQEYLSFTFNRVRDDVHYRPLYSASLDSTFVDASTVANLLIEETGDVTSISIPTQDSEQGFIYLAVEPIE